MTQWSLPCVMFDHWITVKKFYFKNVNFFSLLGMIFDHSKKLTIFFTTWSHFWSLENSWHFFWFLRCHLLITKKELTQWSLPSVMFYHWITVKISIFFTTRHDLLLLKKSWQFFSPPGLTFDHWKTVEIFSDSWDVIFWSLNRSWHNDHCLVWCLMTG